MKGNDNPEALRARFDEFLRRGKKRRTAERFAILEMSGQMQGHFTAEEIGERLRANGFPVSIATVYSSLGLLVDFGYLVKQRFGNQACRYERASVSAATTHHHLICEVCGKIKEVRDPLLSRQIEGKRHVGFTQTYYTLNIYGVCGACSRKKSRTRKPKTKAK